MNAYDTISRIYPETREGGLLARKLLEEVEDLINGLRFRVVLDIGAGAGDNLGVTRASLSNSLYIGCELSMGMIRTSGGIIEWVNCSATHLPIKPESIDLAMSISALHHVPRDLMRRVLRGIYESLRPSGLFIATVWGCDKNSLRRLIPIGDCEGYIPWSHGLGERIPRYYRLFRGGELDDEALKVGFSIIKSGAIMIGAFTNYYIVSRK